LVIGPEVNLSRVKTSLFKKIKDYVSSMNFYWLHFVVHC